MAPGSAHDGAVTCVLPVPGGLHWLTAAADSRVRLWDGATWRHRLVNYPDAHNHSVRGRQLAATTDGRLLYYPTGSAVQASLLLWKRLKSRYEYT